VPQASSKPCPACSDSGWKAIGEGRDRRMTSCECRKVRVQAALLSRIAPRDAWATIEDLQPYSALRVEVAVQEKLLRRLKAQPDGSYFLAGPTGTGKSTLLAALYRHAVVTQTRGCVLVQMVDLLHQLRQAELGEDVIPAITAEKIAALHAGGVRPKLFIDEMDKCTASEFARNSVHRLIDEAYRMAGGDGNDVQLVVCTNLTRDELSDTWGAAILRRLEETCYVVDYFGAAQSWRSTMVPLEAHV
jgi:DNA replication protein DnaC